MLPTHGDHALFNALFFTVELMRHPAFKFLQPGIAVRLEAGFPVIESGSPYMRFLTCLSNITGFLPDLEEKLALLGSGEAKVRMSLAHAVMLPYIRVWFKVQLTKAAIPFVASMQREISLFKLLGILTAVVGGIVEEVFFRRWIMDMLMLRGFASIIQVVISGVAFGLAHTSWTLLAKRDFKATLPAIISTSILGIFLAIIYLAGGRNLGPCIFAHVLINIVIESWLILSAVSGKWRTNIGYV